MSEVEMNGDDRVEQACRHLESAGSLRFLEGLSDSEVVRVVGRLLERGGEAIARRVVEAAVRNLESSRPEFRFRACRFLQDACREIRVRGGGLCVVEDLDRFLEALAGEPDPMVRKCMVGLLGELARSYLASGYGEEFTKSFGTLLSYARAPQGPLRDAAREALSPLDGDEVAGMLLDFIFRGEEEKAKPAAELLLNLGDLLRVEDVVGRLKGEGRIKVTPLLAETCQALEEDLIPALADVLESNAREEVYIRALELLEYMGGRRVVSLARKAASNPLPNVRARALRVLLRVSPGDPGLLALFLKALQDPFPEVRKEGIRGLGEIDDPESVRALLSVLRGKRAAREEDPEVEEAACLALARLGPDKALPHLMDLLRRKSFALFRREPHPRVKAAACCALGEIGGPEAVELVREYLDDPDPLLRKEARKAMAVFRQRGLAD